LTPVLLGVDVGTSRIKAVLVDRSRTVRRRATVPTPFEDQGDGTVEMTPDALRAAVAGAIRSLGERDTVAAVGIAGLAESGAPLRDGQPLAGIPAWFDRRGEEVARRLCGPAWDDLPRRIGQRPRSVSSVAKLGALRDEGMDAPDRWLGVPELVLWWLTGVEATDWSLAARTGALDIGTGTWIDEVCAEIGVTSRVWAPVRRAGEVLGAVTVASAAGFGLPEGIPVTLAGHDHLAAAEAIVGDGELGNSVGTAETVLRLCSGLPDVARAVELGVAVTRRPGGHGWALLAGAARAGLVLTELAARLGADPAVLDRMDTADPASPGGRWAHELERLAERTAEAVRRLTDLTGPARSMVVFGGGSASDQWLAAKARRLSPMELRRSAVPDAAAFGAACAAGVAAGWWPRVSQPTA
jgi:xylulokinase